VSRSRLTFVKIFVRHHAAWPSAKSPPELQHKAPDARIRRDEAVVVDKVLPDRHGVPAAPERLGDELSVRLARARTRRAGGAWTWSGVGGHLHGNCPFWF
jgi:hypothetical protein